MVQPMLPTIRPLGGYGKKEQGPNRTAATIHVGWSPAKINGIARHFALRKPPCSLPATCGYTARHLDRVYSHRT